MSIWKSWQSYVKAWLVLVTLCSGLSVFVVGGVARASSAQVNTFRLSGTAVGTLHIGTDSNCFHGMQTLAKNYGNISLTDLVGSISGYKSVAPSVLAMSAPKDGTYKLAAAAGGVFATLSVTLKTGNLYFNSTGGTRTIKGRTGSINATMVPGVDAKKKVTFVGSWSCKG